MRADNNWEDEIGKRLRELEEEPAPLAWDKIKQDIQPKRNRRWLWLPLLLVLLGSLPVANHYFKSDSANQPTPQLAVNPVTGPASNGPEQRKASSGTRIAAPSVNSETSNGNQATAPSETPGSLAAAQPANGSEVSANQPAGTERPNRNTIAAVPGSDNEKPVSTRSVTIATLPARPEPKTKARSVAASETAKTGNAGVAATTKLSGAIAANARNQNAGKTITAAGTETSAEATKTSPLQNGTTKNQDATKPTEAIAVATRKSEPGTLTGNLQTETDNQNTQTNTVTNPEEEKELASRSQEGRPAVDPVQDAAAAPPKPPTLLATADSASKAESTKAENKEKDKPELTASKWAFSVYATPQLDYQRVAANQDDDVMLVRLNKDDNKTKRLGYEAGLQGSYRLSPKFSLETGLHFTMIKQKLSFTTTTSSTADSIIVQQGSNGQISMSLYNREQNQNYYANYYFGGLHAAGALHLTNRLQATAGAGANWLLDAKSQSVYAAYTSTGIKPYVTSGLRYVIPVKDKFEIMGGPTVQYYLKSIQSHNAPFCTVPVTIGFTLGLQFRKDQ